VQDLRYAIQYLVPDHLQELKERKEELILKTIAAVKDRLTKEINYWDQRADDLRQQEAAGKPNAKLNSTKAQQRADELQTRLERRLQELEQERRLSPLPPVVVGGTLVVPMGLLGKLRGDPQDPVADRARETERVERLAMEAVMESERQLGHEPKDVGDLKLGYDVESRIPDQGLRFIEVKGRIQGADTVTITKNEVLTGLNKPESFVLALVEVPTQEAEGSGCVVRYIRNPFQKEPDFGVTSLNYAWKDLWQRGSEPL
jgi:hypothetical protein